MVQKFVSAITLGVVALNTASGLVLPAVPRGITKLDTRTPGSSWVNNNHLVVRSRAFNEDGDDPEEASSFTPIQGGHRIPSPPGESISANSDSPRWSHKSQNYRSPGSSGGFREPNGRSRQYDEVEEEEDGDTQSDAGEFRRRSTYHRHLVSRAGDGSDKSKGKKKKGSVFNKVLQPFKKGGGDDGDDGADASDGDSSTSSWGDLNQWDALGTERPGNPVAEQLEDRPGNPVAAQLEDEDEGQTDADKGEKEKSGIEKWLGKKGGDGQDPGWASGRPYSSRVRARRETVEDEEGDSIDDMD